MKHEERENIRNLQEIEEKERENTIHPNQMILLIVIRIVVILIQIRNPMHLLQKLALLVMTGVRRVRGLLNEINTNVGSAEISGAIRNIEGITSVQDESQEGDAQFSFDISPPPQFIYTPIFFFCT